MATLTLCCPHTSNPCRQGCASAKACEIEADYAGEAAYEAARKAERAAAAADVDDGGSPAIGFWTSAGEKSRYTSQTGLRGHRSGRKGTTPRTHREGRA